jgi:hypothetical protein
MRKAAIAALCGLAIPALFAGQARAQDLGAPVELAEGLSLDPIFAARLRYETVDQDGITENAQALTLRTRLGAELKLAGGFALLAEGEGTLALADSYNDTLPGNGLEPFPIVADPESLELNRLQVSWAKDGTGITLGRQRIVLDDARFVGNVGWQTFDAVRGQTKAGPLALDATYAISQRTVFGADSPNGHFDGDMALLNGGLNLAVFDVKAFAYLIDYDTRIAFSSQTYGVLAKGEIELPTAGKLNGQASYARQSDYGANPLSYGADFWSAQLGLGVLGFTLTAGYEELGSDGGTAAFQTPLATLHAFNGWADVFLTTPPKGLRDTYVGIARSFAPGLKADLTWHEFDSDFGALNYGSEWNASLGFKLGQLALLAKYANYDAEQFAIDTEKLWLQAEVGF